MKKSGAPSLENTALIERLIAAGHFDVNPRDKMVGYTGRNSNSAPIRQTPSPTCSAYFSSF
jgi:hypothetical protein